MLIATAENIWLVDGIAKLLVMIEDIHSQGERDQMFEELREHLEDSLAEVVMPDNPLELVDDIREFASYKASYRKRHHEV